MSSEISWVTGPAEEEGVESGISVVLNFSWRKLAADFVVAVHATATTAEV